MRPWQQGPAGTVAVSWVLSAEGSAARTAGREPTATGWAAGRSAVHGGHLRAHQGPKDRVCLHRTFHILQAPGAQVGVVVTAEGDGRGEMQSRDPGLMPKEGGAHVAPSRVQPSGESWSQPGPQAPQVTWGVQP